MTDEEAQRMEETQYQRLRQFLAELSPGRVPSNMQTELVQLLQDCWPMFSGSAEEGMEAYKLQRMEDLEWHPPSLAFTIERHGGTAMGSSRAELQSWFVDLDRRVAECQVTGYRQLYPRAAGVNVKPIADELATLVISGSQDERLQWSAGGHVRVRSGKIFGTHFVPKQTLQGRRERLVKAMEECLAPHGWQRRGSWWGRNEPKEKFVQ